MGTWADAVAIQGMARLLGRDIHIVTSQENSTELGYLVNKILAGQATDSLIPQMPLLLGHIGEQHYISLGNINVFTYFSMIMFYRIYTILL
jgi:hypothetical protein